MTSRTYAHNSAVNDPEAEPHSFDLEGATARIIEKNVSAGEFVFEIETQGRILQFKTNQEAVAENWVNWVIACSNEKRYQDTLKQFIHPEDTDEDAELVLNDPVALEKRVSIEIVKRILSEGESAVKDYFSFLSGGNCTDPVSILKKAGVDLTSKAPFETAMKEFEDTLNEFEKLTD